VKQILCINLDKYWDKYTVMHGQQNVKIQIFGFRFINLSSCYYEACFKMLLNYFQVIPNTYTIQAELLRINRAGYQEQILEYELSPWYWTPGEKLRAECTRGNINSNHIRSLMNSLLDNINKSASVKMYIFCTWCAKTPSIFRSSSNHPPGAYV